MIVVKTPSEIRRMKKACVVSARALGVAKNALEPGVSTLKIESLVKEYILSQGAVPSFLGYRGFPSAVCISINDAVVHGIPSETEILKEGDIVSIDVGAFLDGYHGDNAATFPCGEISEEASRLLQTTESSLYEGIEMAKSKNRVGDISNSIQKFVESRNCSVVKCLVGHGVGKDLHEDPDVPNFGKVGCGPRLKEGLTIAIEPIVNLGSPEVVVLSDGWTIVTEDKSLSAHFEHTVAITADGPIILTVCD
jgi:methionyl aminopeptidase